MGNAWDAMMLALTQMFSLVLRLIGAADDAALAAKLLTATAVVQAQLFHDEAQITGIRARKDMLLKHAITEDDLLALNAPASTVKV